MDDNSSSTLEPSTPGPSNETPKDNGHKRTPSGGLSKLAILRASAENNVIQADTPLSPEQKHSDLAVASKKASRAMAAVVQQQKTRRRKGSLRKAALLGRGAQREKNQLDTSPLVASNGFGSDGGSSPISPDETSLHGSPFGINSPARPERPRYPVMGSYTSPRASPSSEHSSFSLPGPILSPQPRPIVTNPNTLKPSPPLSYTTTDDDEPLSFASRKPDSPAPSSSVSQTSYFGNHLPSSLFHRRSTSRLPSPLSHNSSPTAPNDTWDYSTTAFWGYVILISTWLVFVVGIGSCFEIWSWAWDVGETPYAPPELEDDPTLPITGYYPALIILTAVMAWVWVTTAWVGMKYFRHARISGD